MKRRRLRKELWLGILTIILLLILNILQNVNQALKALNEAKRLELEELTMIQELVLDEQVLEQSSWIEPCSTSSVKSYMEVSSITSKTSKQYQFIQENMEARNGLLFDREGYIGVALGSWFGDIGTRWIVELSSGEKLYVIKIDEKDDKHVVNGCEHKVDKSVIEFVVDPDTNIFEYGSNGLILSGNFNNHEWFNGDIVKVKLDE